MQRACMPTNVERPRSRSKSRRRGDEIRPKELSGSTQLVVYDPAAQSPLVKHPAKQPIKPRGRHPKQGKVPQATRWVGIRQGDVRAAYKVLPAVIGAGSFGTVRSCIHRESRAKLAIKSIATSSTPANASLLRNEIFLLQRVNHPNVVKVVDVVQDGEYIHIVMEQCRGGDLFDATLDGERLGEGRIRKIVASLLDAIAYLHERNCVHRDLKAEHLMFSANDVGSAIKIIDFGVATVHKPGDAPMTAFAGSLRSMAPEVVKRSYGKECDLWSVGVITYFLLTRLMPFDSPTGDQKEIFQKIVAGKYFYPRWAATGLSEGAKDFVGRLIVVDPRRRLTARQALNHPWISGKKLRRNSGKLQAKPVVSGRQQRRSSARV